ncbi:unnamed protein product [Effrenium voratum]|uniref:J domain-containing protein n=1 Tax=Effrenium voratum TaxID=2562239 RepID=A0AA36N184_9DINO|nr:unnamed protein product [Effrenium voratum]
MADGDDDLWDTLNLQPGASVDEVGRAFRELSKVYHPDKNSATGGEAAFRRVHRAYQVLSNETYRGFYEKYGLPGVRLAEMASDDGAEGQVALNDDRVKDLESRVRRLVRKHEELRAQRLLGLNGSFLLSSAATPATPASIFNRRFRLHYSALSYAVQVQLSERFKVSIGCASHVQSSSGSGAAKLMLAANTSVVPGTNVRTMLNVTGSSPEAELSVLRSLSPNCTVQQKLGFSRDGRHFSLQLSPWLSRTLRGGLTWNFSGDPSLSFFLNKTSLSCGHSVRFFTDLQPGVGEVGFRFKYKPVKGFSLKLSPTVARQGPGLQMTCSKASRDGLTKLHWALNVRLRGLGLRLTICRCGLRFVLPLEIWAESDGPLPASELAMAATLWAAAPFVISLLRQGWLFLSNLNSDQGSDSSAKDAKDDLAVQQEAAGQRALLAEEAARRRKEEEAVNGLMILSATYGAAIQTPAEALGRRSDGVGKRVDVTPCLMARVKNSSLQLSDAPKSRLLGFGPTEAGDAAVLEIHYQFGGRSYTQSFGEHEVVMLP